MIKIAELEKSIKSNDMEISKNRAENESLKYEMEAHKKEIERLEGIASELNAKILNKASTYRRNNNNISKLLNQNLKDQESLENEKHRIAVDALMNDEPSFWEALRGRLSHQISELEGGMSNISSYMEPSDFTDFLHRIADHSKEFSERSIAIRGARNLYTDKQKEICSKAVKGEVIPYEAKQAKIKILDRLILDKNITPIWNK